MEVLAGELVVAGMAPLQEEGRFLLDCTAEDDDDEEEVKALRPKSLMKLSICYRQTWNDRNKTYFASAFTVTSHVTQYHQQNVAVEGYHQQGKGKGKSGFV